MEILWGGSIVEIWYSGCILVMMFVGAMIIVDVMDKRLDKKIRDNTDCVIEYVNGRFMLIDKRDKDDSNT